MMSLALLPPMQVSIIIIIFGSWLWTSSLTWFWKEGFRGPLQFQAIIFMTKKWLGIRHSSNRGRSFASSIKFHPVILTISFVCPLLGISVTQCSSTPIIFSAAIEWILNSMMGWKTCSSFVACRLPMNAVVMAWFSNILLVDKLSSSITSHNIEVVDTWGMVFQTNFLTSFGPWVSERNFHQGSIILPQAGFVRCR